LFEVNVNNFFSHCVLMLFRKHEQQYQLGTISMPYLHTTCTYEPSEWRSEGVRG
jgi:hypothetical protein